MLTEQSSDSPTSLYKQSMDELYCFDQEERNSPKVMDYAHRTYIWHLEAFRSETLKSNLPTTKEG